MSKDLPQSQSPKIQRVFQHKPIAAAVSVLLLCSPLAWAQESSEKMLPRIDVVGSSENQVAKQTGAVAIVTKEAISLAQPLSTQDALKTVPGISVREEEGYGFIPNIGLRGLDPNRSQKVLVLEDGVPIAPSLFIANESYYSPRIERMESIEVLKGAAGLRYGPTTIGGVINYQTKQPEDGVLVTAKGGSHGYQLYGIDAGGKNKAGDAVGGLSLISSQGDGFRNNGFDMKDAVIKGGMALGEKQWVSIKFTHYENKINTSYVGLRPNEFINTPNKNSAPNDYFLSDRNSIDVNHEWDLSQNTKIKTLIYWSELQRDFWRQKVNSVDVNGTTFTSGITGAIRNFQMFGIDSRAEYRYAAFGIKNEAELGVRLHTESRKNQSVLSNDEKILSGALKSDQDSSANSVALYGQNRFIINEKLAITPGLRIESYIQKDHIILDTTNPSKNGIKAKTSNTEIIPGMGATWQLTPEAQLFTGVFKGFSPAMMNVSLEGGVDRRLDAETSTNYEIGMRGKNNQLRYEMAAFHMNFENQIVNQSSSGGVARSNAGKTLHQGLEFMVGWDVNQEWAVDANWTYLPTAEFKSNRAGTNGSLTANVQGNRLPYAPESIANLGFNFKSEKSLSRLSVMYVSSQFVDAANTVNENIVDQTVNGVTYKAGELGRIPAYMTLNLSTKYFIDKNTQLFAAIRNLTNEKYIASRHPNGIFPGVARNMEIGISYKF